MAPPPLHRVATDVGGTFTDLVAFTSHDDGTLDIKTAKTGTTPPDFETGVLDVLEKAGIDPGEVDFMAHGTTVVINAITERKGVTVGLLTTQGFRDTLEIARGNRPDFFNLHYVKPAPFVPRALRAELPGRMTWRGEERAPLDLSGLPDIIADFRARKVEAVAICLLHAYANTAHEKAVLEEVRRLWPGIPAVASHQITREWREYERTSTAVLSAYVQPVAARYLGRLDSALKARGLARSPFIMQSNCGVDSLAATAAIPVTMVESGPASGFRGAAELGKLIGEPDILALDIGGTTAKCSLITDGDIRINTDYWIERSRKSAGYPIMVPVVDLVEIGNGGGSIARVDDFGKLHVGPQSAGARPGPAAYGKGGRHATTTDANLWLGRINPDYFFGGEIKADMEAVRAALRALGQKLGTDEAGAARGIIRIANNNMVNALKLVSLNRGHDTRDFTLLAFGGGGAMHAVALGQELQMRKIIVPAAASVFSALGMMMSDLARDYFVTQLVDMTAGCAGAVESLFARTEAHARTTFAAEGMDAERLHLRRFGKFRYQNQEHTTAIPLPRDIDEAQISNICAAFQSAYEKEYSYRLDAPVEMVGIHLAVSAGIGKLTLRREKSGPPDAQAALKGRRIVDYALEGCHEAAIYDGAQLMPGMRFEGPAIVEDSGTTVVVHPQNRVEIDPFRNIIIKLESAS